MTTKLYRADSHEGVATTIVDLTYSSHKEQNNKKNEGKKEELKRHQQDIEIHDETTLDELVDGGEG